MKTSLDPYYSKKNQAIRPKDFVSVAVWTANLVKERTLPVNLVERFVIAQYQIGDAFKWPVGQFCRYQQIASGIIHLFCCAEQEGLDLCGSLEIDLQSHPTRLLDYSIALDFIKTAKLVFYKHQRSRSKRANRRSDDSKLIEGLAGLITSLISSIPRSHRGNAFYHEMRLLNKDLN